MCPQTGEDGSSPGEITDLLLAWNGGDGRALDRLVPLVYDELRRLADRHFVRERPGHTLEPTALVHEAYVRLIDQRRVTWKNRGHFFAVAAQMMRRILIDYARGRQADKRGGGGEKVTLDDGLGAEQPGRDVDVIALDEALTRLKAFDSMQAQIVDLRFFAGLTIEETADVLETSPASVKREFRSARAWLFRELGAS